MAEIEHPWSLPVGDVMAALGVTSQGLTRQQASSRLQRDGPNRLQRKQPRSILWIFADQFRSLLVAILAAAAAAAFVFGRRFEGFAVVGVLGINALIGFAMELRATRSVEALARLVRTTATVLRDGAQVRVAAEELVRGDIVVLDAGVVIGADLRVLEANRLAADESVLTGEALPVTKASEPVSVSSSLSARATMLYSGTTIVRGSGKGVVVATATYTELGTIAELVKQMPEETTPLEQRLDRLGWKLAWLSGALAAFIALTAHLSGRSLVAAVEMAIALAVATVPEGLPIVATLALARGMRRMARRHALVRRLSAVETLGCTSVLITDKTGTLTQNRLTVTKLWMTDEVLEMKWTSAGLGSLFHDGKPASPGLLTQVKQMLRLGVLCNNADLVPRQDGLGVGDPLELALLAAGAGVGVSQDRELRVAPELREEAFDPERRMMATFHGDGEQTVAVKGSPEAVLAACDWILTRSGPQPMDAQRLRQVSDAYRTLARQGLRVLALAFKQAPPTAPPYQGLTLAGFVGMEDPPRDDVKSVVRACQAAGVRVVMATGDHPDTAEQVARRTGILDGTGGSVCGDDIAVACKTRVTDYRVFARTSPGQKLDLIEAFRKQGEVVAMIGDGVNDAPALSAADIGIAMGKRGTEVAKEASDVVLQDDELATIVEAIREGRIIFDNMRKFVVYLLSCNTSELLAVGIASLMNLPLPILPLQILYLNLVTDVFPALALGTCEASSGVLSRRPRPKTQPLLTGDRWIRIGLDGLVLTAAVLLSQTIALNGMHLSEGEAVTVSFLTLGFAQTLHVLNMRGRGTLWLRNEVSTNPWIWGAVLLCAVLLVLCVALPGLSHVLGTQSLSGSAWGVVALCSAAPLLIGPLVARVVTAPPSVLE